MFFTSKRGDALVVAAERQAQSTDQVVGLAILHEEGIKLKFSGNEISYTAYFFTGKRGNALWNVRRNPPIKSGVGF